MIRNTSGNSSAHTPDRRSRSTRRSAPGTPASAAGIDLDRINHLNSGLMLASAAIAWFSPLEVLLVSYAVLGPLHYLTQISWLHDRGHFTTGRWDWLPLAVLGALAAGYVGGLQWALAPLAALGLGVTAAFVRSNAIKLAALGASALAAWRLADWPPAVLLFATLLPTVIHVYVFTGLFVLAGSLKAKSRSGYLSLGVFLACGLGLLLVQPATDYTPTPWAHANLDPFLAVIAGLAALVPGEGSHAALVAIGRFLGFAYTYHYLNWFSKTEVIRWHRIPRRRGVAIAILWLASVALYAIDYARGLAALFFLSLVHVFLEFPLDAKTAADVLRGRR